MTPLQRTVAVILWRYHNTARLSVEDFATEAGEIVAAVERDRAGKGAPQSQDAPTAPAAPSVQGPGNCASCGRLLTPDGTAHVGVTDDAECTDPRPAAGWTADHCAALRLHLLKTHHNEAAAELSDAEALDQHWHEHHGPGGLRNHDQPAQLHGWAPATWPTGDPTR